MNYKVVQIYYDQESLRNCYQHPKVELYYNGSCNDFFENKVILHKRHEMLYYDYYGVWSHRHKHKVQGQQFSFDKMAERLTGLDVLAFQRFLRNGRIFSGIWEKKYRDMFNFLMIKLGMKYRFNVKCFVVMQNHFITRGWIYAEYVDNVLKPAIELIKEMPESLEKTKYKDGSYNFRPFLCEKLFSAYLYERNFKCEQW